MAMSLEEMYNLALNPKLFPDSRLLAVMQGRDTSIPMAVAMSAKQMRDKEATAAKGAQAQAQAAQPSVKDQMLAKGMQQHMAGIDQLHAPTMESMGEEGMAGGGLVSFAMGGLNDDDESDPEQDDQDELEAMMAQHGDLGGLGAGIMAVANPAAAKYSSFTKPGISPSSAPGQFKDIAADAAKRHGASWDLVQHVMKKETGGLKDAANAVSSKGATGVMQLMPATARELGVKNINDPNENINAGVKYLAQLEKQFKDPKLAAMAYNWGPGNVKKWLAHGAKESAVPKETRMYVASLAKGGIVSLAKGGDYTSFGEETPYDPDQPSISDTIGNMLGSPMERLKNSMLGVGAKSNKEIAADLAAAKAAKNAPAKAPMVDTSVNTPDQNVPSAPATGIDSLGSQAATPSPIAADPFAASQSRLDKYLSNLESQRKQDQGISAILGGLTAAGTPGPLTSALAKGAQTGGGYYSDAQKGYNSAMAQGLGAQAALDRNRVYQQMYGNKAGELGKYQLMSEFDKIAQAQLASIDKDATKKMWPQDKKAAEAQRLAALQIKANPLAVQRYKEFGVDVDSLYTPVPILSNTAPTGAKEYK